MIATLRTKSQNTNQRKIDVRMDNKETWRRIETTTQVSNNFNQESSAEIKPTKRLMKEADLHTMLMGDKVHREIK